MTFFISFDFRDFFTSFAKIYFIHSYISRLFNKPYRYYSVAFIHEHCRFIQSYQAVSARSLQQVFE